MKRNKTRIIGIWIIALLLLAPVLTAFALADEGIEDTGSVAQEMQPQPEEALPPAETPVEEAEPEQTPVGEEEPIEEAEPEQADAANEEGAEPTPTEEPTEDNGDESAKPETFTIKFVDSKGYLIEAVVLNKGAIIHKPEKDPEMSGGRFKYWYDVDDSNMEEFIFDPVQYAHKDLILKALFDFDGAEEETSVGSESEIEGPLDTEEPEPETEEESEVEEEVEVVQEEQPGEDEILEEETPDEPAETEEDPVTYLTVNAGEYEFVNLREAPSMDADVAAKLANGTQVILLEDMGDWKHVSFTALSGYIRADLFDGWKEEHPPAIERSVTIAKNVGDTVFDGDEIVLTGTLIGFDGCQVELQWQYSEDGEHWIDAVGGTYDTFTFRASEEYEGVFWRLNVSVLEESVA